MRRVGGGPSRPFLIFAFALLVFGLMPVNVQSAQVGLHEAATGETDAFLSVAHRQLLSATNFDGTDNADLVAFTNTTASDGDVRLATTTEVLSHATFDSTETEAVAAGADLTFPFLPAATVAFDAGEDMAVALGADGFVYAWGDGDDGQLGDGAAVTRSVPVRVRGGQQGGTYLDNIVAVDAGRTAMVGLDGDGGVWTWGLGADGELGNGQTWTSGAPLASTPVRVLGGEQGGAFLQDVVNVSMGGGYALAVVQDGSVYAWGDGGNLQLGAGSGFDRSTPVRVRGGQQGGPYLTGIVGAVAGMGDGTSFALAADGSLWAWGAGGSGQIGDGGIDSRSSPVRVLGGQQGGTFFENVVQVSVGWRHVFAVTGDGAAWAWGSETSGRLGNDNSGGISTTPVHVKGGGQGGVNLVNVTWVSAGEAHSYGRDASGAVYAWGHDNVDQRCDGAPSVDERVPVRALGGEQGGTYLEAVVVHAGYLSGYARDASGAVYACGAEYDGRLGNGATASTQPTPVRVHGGDQGGPTFAAASMSTADVTRGHYESGILSGLYEVTGVSDERTLVGSVTATLAWRSGWTASYSPMTWTPWATGLPEKRPYYQYRYDFSKAAGDAASIVHIHGLTATYTRHPSSGSLTVQWTVPDGLSADRVRLAATTLTPAGTSVSFAIRAGPSDPFSPLAPDATHAFASPTTGIVLQASFASDWDTPTLTDVTLDWTAEGESTTTGATTRSVGAASETNEATLTPSTTLPHAWLKIPVSSKVRGVLNVTNDTTLLAEASSLPDVDVDRWYYDAAAQVVYVGVHASAGVALTRRVTASHGAAFDLTVPTHLASGDYYVVSGTIRGQDGRPVEGVQAEVAFYQSDALRYGPVKKFVVAGNLELSVSTNFIPPGAYNVTVAFVDSSGVRFVEARPLTVSGGRQVVAVGSGFDAYANARVHFSFFDSDTGFGLDPAFLRVLARDDGEPRSTDRLFGSSYATTTGLTLRYRVEDYWGDRVFPVGSETSASLVVDAREMFVDVGLNLLDLKIKNTNSSVIHLHLSKAGATRSEYVLPQEIVSFALRAGTYEVALDYYNAATGAYQRTLRDNLTVATDLFYWVRGHDLGDIVIEIHNAESSLGQQLVDVNVNVQNVNSTIGTQLVSTRNEVRNANTTIQTQLLLLRSLLDSTNSTIGRLVQGLDANLTNRLVNQSILLVDALENVSVGEELLDALRRPHTIFVPAFNYTGLANDTLPPTSYVQVSPDLLDEGAVIVRWGASDNALLLHVRLEYRKEGGDWVEIGSFAAQSGEERVTGLDPGATYEFRSQAKDAADNLEALALDARQPNYATFEAGSGTTGVEFRPPDRRAFFVPGPNPLLAILGVGIVAAAWGRRFG